MTKAEKVKELRDRWMQLIRDGEYETAGEAKLDLIEEELYGYDDEA